MNKALLNHDYICFQKHDHESKTAFILFENSHIWGFTAQSSVSRNSSGLMVGEFASSTGAKVIHKSR